MSRASDLKDLQVIPGIGPSMAIDLYDLGVRAVEDLRGRDPQEMYDRLSAMRGPQDRCVLYVFRCAVYFAASTRHDPEKLKWWNWKDGGIAMGGPRARRNRRAPAP